MFLVGSPAPELSVDAPSQPRPASEMSYGFLRVNPEKWHVFAQRERPPVSGWIAVPRRNDVSVHMSESLNRETPVVPAHVCGECHTRQYEGFLQTAHHRTSRSADAESILGDFRANGGRMETINPSLWFQMEQDGDQFHQRTFVRHGGKTFTHGERLDVVTGSGNHGQTYLYWNNDALYQLPVSFLTESKQWVNSPGFYQDGTADFSRPITARCLECHATYVKNIDRTANRYDRSQIMLGVACVRCHGPGEEHVAYHTAHPDESEGKDIVHPGRLSRERSNEVCAQCHSGIGKSLQPPFSYRPGEPLAEYLRLEHRGEEVHGGVHTDDQLARLRMSRCFQASDSMTCATCHNPHQHERGKLALFSERCRTCHQADDCHVYPEVGEAIRERCIDCHMPKRRDREMKFHTQRGVVDLLMLRDHYIRGWPQATEETLEEIRTDKQP